MGWGWGEVNCSQDQRVKEEDPAVNRKEDRKLGNKKKEMRDGVVCFLFKSLVGCVHRQRDQSGKRAEKRETERLTEHFAIARKKIELDGKRRERREKKGRKSRRAVMSCTALAAWEEERWKEEVFPPLLKSVSPSLAHSLAVWPALSIPLGLIKQTVGSTRSRGGFIISGH